MSEVALKFITEKEFVLIDSVTTHLIHYIKNDDLTWTFSDTKNINDHFTIATINFQTALADIYAGS